MLGAGVAPVRYLRIALPPLGFLAARLPVAGLFARPSARAPRPFDALAAGRLATAATRRRARSARWPPCSSLPLTTPLIDLIALLRRLQSAGSSCSKSWCSATACCSSFPKPYADTRTAQAARLGYATPRLAMRSLGSLAANLTVQIWQRAHALHVAAQSRNNDGPLRFLEPSTPHAAATCALPGSAAPLDCPRAGAWHDGR
jgi:cobalt/nickel transport system permease protein